MHLALRTLNCRSHERRIQSNGKLVAAVPFQIVPGNHIVFVASLRRLSGSTKLHLVAHAPHRPVVGFRQRPGRVVADPLPELRPVKAPGRGAALGRVAVHARLAKPTREGQTFKETNEKTR